MTDTRTQTVQSTATVSIARRGRWCIAASLVGIAQGAVVLAWPHQVDASRYSFPFTANGFVIAQATFFLQHLPLAVAVFAVATLPAVRRTKLAHRALVVATAGLGLLALMELVGDVGRQHRQQLQARDDDRQPVRHPGAHGRNRPR